MYTEMKKFIAVAGVLLIALIAGTAFVQTDNKDSERPQNNSQAEVMAEGLEVPWDIEFLPDGDILVTERPGNLLRMEKESGNYTESYKVEGVEHAGEGGLLGVTKHPNFTENKYIYLYMTTRDGEKLRNRVERYRLNEDQLSEPETVISGLPGAIYHDGGRIDFGPDGKLYITAGDATKPQWAQEREKLAGKILRINPDGTVPRDNPFDNEIYSYGHRNPQGLTWVKSTLWATEHGDWQNDELNRIQKGGNYGWPEIEADQNMEDMIRPEIYAEDTTWAPAGTVFTNGSIYFAGLKGKTLYEAKIQNNSVTGLEKHLQKKYGRLRAVEKGPEGHLYVSTSNTDGRGIPVGEEDKILRIDPDDL